MPDTIRTQEQLLEQFVDNTSGLITAQDLRDLIVSVYDRLGNLSVGTVTGGRSGEVARSLANRVLDTINVKDYGAVGNGSTDDTDAINTALAAGANKTVLFPPGTYLFSEEIAVPATVRVEFESAKLLVATGFTAGANNCCLFLGGADIYLGGMVLDASGVSSPPNALVGGWLPHRLIMENCKITGTTATNNLVALVVGEDITITGCHLFTSGAKGLNLFGWAGNDNTEVSRCYFDDIPDGIYFTTSEAGAMLETVRVLDNVLVNIPARSSRLPITFQLPLAWVRDGIHYHKRITIRGNRIIGPNLSFTAGTGTADSIGAYQCSDSIITQNYVYGSGDNGIALTDGENNVVASNVLVNCDTYGITVENCINSSITGNVCMNNGQTHDGTYSASPLAGIALKTHEGGVCADIVVTGNRCGDTQGTKTQKYGIWISSGVTGELANATLNLLTGNLTNAILDES